MKYIAQFSRLFVGGIFIFSGLVKLNDPVGTQIKLEEYFEVFATDFPWMAAFWEALVPFALVFSVVLCSLEVLLGVALLASWRIKQTAWALFGLCVFFGFLTFYSAYYNKVTDCGCFGDFIKLKPWTSFWKDMILLFFILIILWQRKIYKNLNTNKIMLAATIFCLGLGIYAIRYMPPVDFLPYAVGQNIPKNMQPSEPLQFKYIMEKDGKEQEFSQNPTDTTFKFKQMITLNEDAAKAKITDYDVFDSAGSHKEESFQGNKLMVIIPKVAKASTAHIDEIRALAKSLEGSNITMQILTADSDSTINNFRHEHQLAIPYLFCDYKVLKTISRTNPGLWMMSNGTVKGKWSHNCVPSKEKLVDN